MNSDDDICSSSSNTSTPIHSDHINLQIENTISIDNIQEEINLIDYTENHFNTKIQQDLGKIRELLTHETINSKSYQNFYIRSNSPVTISNNGSGSGSCCESESDNNDMDYDTDNENKFMFSNIGYKKLSYSDTLQIIHKYYDLNNDNKFSSEIDILTTYVKAQKNLYIQSNHITQRKLNCLMFPTLLISSVITMLAPFIECTQWNGGVISALNAIIMLCVSFINYLKLESSIENYLQNAKQYDKIETTLEMTNSKLLFIENNKEKTSLVLNKIKEIEKKMTEIKESTNILLPEEIKILFPIICHINIFSFIKKVEIYKKNLILKFRDIKNEIRYILYKLGLPTQDTVENMKLRNRLQFLYEIKNKLKDEIFDFQNAYSQIDSIFTKEINYAEIKKNEWLCLSFFCFFKRPIHKSYTKGMNPIIDKYFQFIFADE
jgi:hypothetical protein